MKKVRQILMEVYIQEVVNQLGIWKDKTENPEIKKAITVILNAILEGELK